MFRKITLYHQIFQNMGWRYALYRVFFTLKGKFGLLKKQFPVNPPYTFFIDLEKWRALPFQYFSETKEKLQLPQNKSPELLNRYKDFQSGKLWFFNSTPIEVGTNYDWLTNPYNGYKYEISRHWSEINDFSEEAGDIKYVWEKSRFSYLTDLIRYDYHFDHDLSSTVLGEIADWIQANLINQGPNYKCSQEISIRLLNWIFALNYYKNAPALTEDLFQKIQHNIYWQLRHVYENINYSRYTVRNNHAITECLMLYIGGLLFPYFPESEKWKKKGKKWFEQEIIYQVYEDGTFLQYSHNYHRVLIQLFTVAFRVAEVNGERFSPEIYERAKKSLNYLFQCMAGKNGELPNYGSNDGALFFKWNDASFRDYRPQLNTLHYFFTGKNISPEFDLKQTEDVFWLGLNSSNAFDATLKLSKKSVSEFSQGGVYTIHDANTFTFIKCAGYRTRPAQADNMHIDIWVDGENIFRDAGTFRYNASTEQVRYFAGTKGHNTVMLGDSDQMLKGPRFIWLYWSKLLKAGIDENVHSFEFFGETEEYRFIKKGISHQRRVLKEKGKSVWTIDDRIDHGTGKKISQRWHFDPVFDSKIKFKSTAELKNKEAAYYSGEYGKIEVSSCVVFTTERKNMSTTITFE